MRQTEEEFYKGREPYPRCLPRRSFAAGCLLCPRRCGVDRLAGKRGFCRETAELRVAAAVLHRGEEPPLSGSGGSGTIFISGCNLGCVFCQNWQISRASCSQDEDGDLPMGSAVSTGDFARICLLLQEKGAENINIVTGSHAVPAIAEGLAAARKAGLHIPALWNSSAYETPETLELLRENIDIYLPDLKTLDASLAAVFFRAPDYPQAAEKAIRKMMEMTGGRREKLLIRHLVLPGFLDATREVLRWFADNAKDKARLSLMTQYTPMPSSGAAYCAVPERFLNETEYETVLYWLDEFGIEEGFCQELVTGSDWLPDFSRTNPFPSELSVPVWHFTSPFSVRI